MKLYNNIFHDKELLRDLLKHANLFNTVNGGIVPTSVNIANTEEEIIIKVFAPTIKAESFNIILNYTKLTISIFAQQMEENEKPIFVPMFIQTFDIPPIVDFDGIEAVYKNGELEVILPLRNTRESMQRLIEITQL